MSVNTTTRYIVYNHSGSGVRHHHFSAQNNIINQANGTAGTGTNMIAFGIPVLQYNGIDVPFAFMSVNGGSDGNKLYTSPGNQNVPVGTSDINILVVYAPPGGIGSGDGTGIWVDAFNVNTGDFSDDLHFIEILTPPTPPDNADTAKTDHANLEGDVSSLAPEHIRASAAIDGGVPFVEWKKITPTESILNTRDFDIVQNETGEIWFAFYQTHSFTPPNVHLSDYAESVMILFGITNDAPGAYIDAQGHIHFVGPGDPGPILRELIIVMAAYKTAEKVKGKAGAAMQHLALGAIIDIAQQAGKLKEAGR